ncbi:rCG40844 [Rattus norvegicus]|uniref:RCG40844 n=1 Tax=Rattus norvegicus TaxID=10116 RepID=A6KL42_RAT|nr:rCG40844 [Rattus norvegicus]
MSFSLLFRLLSSISLWRVTVSSRLDVSTAVLKQSGYDDLQEALTRSLWRWRAAHRLSGSFQRISQGCVRGAAG